MSLVAAELKQERAATPILLAEALRAPGILPEHVIRKRVVPAPKAVLPGLLALPVIIGHQSITIATVALTMGLRITTLPAVLYAVNLMVLPVASAANVAVVLVLAVTAKNAI